MKKSQTIRQLVGLFGVGRTRFNTLLAIKDLFVMEK